jgi:broad specificity phosphatase PhoE
MRFELIFIRHGESCANVLMKQKNIGKKIAHKFYIDPELSTRGRLLSEMKSHLFTKYLQELDPFDKSPWNTDQFTLGASELFRAQETAYLMVGRNKEKPIFVFPFLGERGFGGKVFRDNTALKKPEQKEVFQERYPQMDVNSLLPDEKDARAGPPQFKKFLEWIPKHLDYFQKGEDGVYRAVIVSHSNSLKDAFPFDDCVNPPASLPHDDKLDNNDFLVSIFELGPPENAESPQYLVPQAVYPKWYYFDTRVDNKKVEQKCGKNEMCSRKNVMIESSCSMEGGKRKTQRRRSSTLRRLSKKVRR